MILAPEGGSGSPEVVGARARQRARPWCKMYTPIPTSPLPRGWDKTTLLTILMTTTTHLDDAPTLRTAETTRDHQTAGQADAAASCYTWG